MKKGFLYFLVSLAILSLLSGCALNNPLAKKNGPNKPGKQVGSQDAQKDEVKPQEKVEVDKVVVQMVNETRSGFFQKAILTGEAVYEAGKKSEKFLDTLVVAYGYKNTLEGLNEEEAQNYVRAVRELVKTDPANRYKNILLAGALLGTDKIEEANKVALELYNAAGEAKPKEVLDIYGWALYKSGKNPEAWAVFNTLNNMGPDNLSQTYHTATVMETVDKARALALYKRIVEWANNALTWEENRDNLASTALINKIKKDSQDAINRIQLKGRSAH